MSTRRYLFTLVAILITLFALTGCPAAAPAPETPTSAPAQPAPTDTSAPPTPEPTVPAEPEPTATPSNAITALKDVRKATIQIEAQGTFMDPEVGLQLNAAGRGSGFIIDESGIAVTNNHVVTGAALLKVWVGGESRARNARILAVSECSDLAVIDIDGGDYPYLRWYEGDVTPGLDVYAAGFPLGDPEFTLTRGIVSKQHASGETNWASVDSAIEHDATINPGNSGGPLVSDSGEIVGVNYASSESDQYYAISREEALDTIDALREGINVDSIGLNGTAVNDGESVSGIWVSSVESGSPADKAKIKTGDIVTRLEGLVLATDGTMADYCDILRSHNADDTLNVEVLRFETEEVLEGQLNGRELEPVFSFAAELEGEVPVEEGGEEAGYSSYTVINDADGIMTMEVPEEWNDVDSGIWTMDEEEVGIRIVAAGDIDAFYDTYVEPGVFFGASRILLDRFTPEALLDANPFDSDCTFEGRDTYEDALYSGAFDVYTNCDGGEASLIEVAAIPEDGAYIILLQIAAVTEPDLDALDRILQSFQVVGELP